MIGENNPFYGKKHTIEAKLKIGNIAKGRNYTKEQKESFATIGEINSQWMGDKVGYSAIHSWVRKWKGQSGICEKCGKTNLKGQQIHWANIDHQYHRILDDYIRLCALCHRQYDIENGLI